MKIAVILAGVLLLFVLGIYFMTLGVADTSIAQVCGAVQQGFSGTLYENSDGQSAQRKVVFLIRFPRLVLSVFAGAGLAISGVAMQGITRNPMVSPFTIGISAAAAFGASLAIVFGIGILPGTEVGIVLNAFFASMLCALLVYGVSRRTGMRPESVVLTGIAFNYIFSALTSTIEFFAAEHKLASVVEWTFGTFNGATWEETLVVMAFVTACTLVIARFALMLNVASSGEDELVRSLGVNPTTLRVIMGVCSVLMTAAIISFTGVIGFVGLVGPHIGRILIGNDHRYLIPFSGVVGALLMIVADTLGRMLLSPVSIPVGIVVSFIGVPLFIHLILNKKEV
ncbi:MAG: iron ABC transporter permease [Peptococcaceae bacterium]|nr:iron ABC transporter permease [Peptococcaceae bacterium]